MRHATIDYGIDLGTTNSAICRLTQGVPEIMKSDNGTEIMPSCVSFKKGGALQVGHSAYMNLGRDKLRALKMKSLAASNSFIEFKRYMGTDFRFSNEGNRWSPEELSAQVIRTLCSFVQDDEVKAAVITVPAKFTVNQKDATLEAARLAGIRQVELLQEPIAASFAYGLKAEEKNGIWMVFDFGGGTLDVALVHAVDGIMQVFDTEGDNYLGGKNIDEAIVSSIILPQLTARFAIDLSDDYSRKLLSDALKVEAEKVKNKLSFCDSETLYLEAGDWGEDEDGVDIEMSITITREEFENAVRPVLQKAVDVCKDLMLRNNISYGKLSHLLPIGGPTVIPLLRRMLREQVSGNIVEGVNPMTAVATGAAIYASTIPMKYEDEDAEDIVRFSVEFETTTVDKEIFVPVIPDRYIEGLSVKMIRKSDLWESETVAMGENGGVLAVGLISGQPNVFRLSASVKGTEVRCFPPEITVLQGMRASTAILPYNIGIEAFKPQNKRRVFTALNGLEKNRPIPASGTVYGLKTMSDLRPGNDNDIVRIAVYQGDENAEGKSAALYEYVSDVVVTGADIVSYIPEDSLINIRVNVDRSEMMSVIAEFPETGQTVEKTIDTSRRQSTKGKGYLEAQIHHASDRIKALTQILEDQQEIKKMEGDLIRIEHDLDSGAQHKQVEQHLKEILRVIEELEESSEWIREKKRIQKVFLDLQIAAADKKDDPGVAKIMTAFENQMERVMLREDIIEAKTLCRQIEDYEYNLTFDKRCRDAVFHFHAYFNLYSWKDPAHAQKLLIEAKEAIAKDPEVKGDVIYPILNKILSLRSTIDNVGFGNGGGNGKPIDANMIDIPSI